MSTLVTGSRVRYAQDAATDVIRLLASIRSVTSDSKAEVPADPRSVADVPDAVTGAGGPACSAARRPAQETWGGRALLTRARVAFLACIPLAWEDGDSGE
jgi:hypothetical protein